jgi:hypothetical protein
MEFIIKDTDSESENTSPRDHAEEEQGDEFITPTTRTGNELSAKLTGRIPGKLQARRQ